MPLQLVQLDICPYLHLDDGVPRLERDEEEELRQEEACCYVLVDAVAVGGLAPQQAEGHEGYHEEDQRQHQARVSRDVLSNGRLGEELGKVVERLVRVLVINGK